MKMMKKLCCLLLAFALLLSFGCKKNDPAETPDVPDAPVEPAPVVPAEPAPEQPKEEEPVREFNTWPALTPDKVIPEKDEDTLDLDAREAAFNSYSEQAEAQVSAAHTVLFDYRRPKAVSSKIDVAFKGYLK